MHLTLSQAFPAVSTLAAGGSGLVGLKDRIEAFGGTMTLDSPSGAGTTLVAQLPLPEHPALEAEPASAAGEEPRRKRAEPASAG